MGIFLISGLVCVICTFALIIHSSFDHFHNLFHFGIDIPVGKYKYLCCILDCSLRSLLFSVVDTNWILVDDGGLLCGRLSDARVL